MVLVVRCSFSKVFFWTSSTVLVVQKIIGMAASRTTKQKKQHMSNKKYSATGSSALKTTSTAVNVTLKT